MTQPNSYLSKKAISDGTNSFYSLDGLYAGCIWMVMAIIITAIFYRHPFGLLILLLFTVFYVIFYYFVLPNLPSRFKGLRLRYLNKLELYNQLLMGTIKEVIIGAEKEIFQFENINYYGYLKGVIPNYYSNVYYLKKFPSPVWVPVDEIDEFFRNLVAIKKHVSSLGLKAEDLDQVKIVELMKKIPNPTEEQYVILGKISELAMRSREIKEKLEKNLKTERELLVKEIVSVLNQNNF